MKQSIFLSLLLAVILPYSTQAISGGYDWVEPGEYRYGHCGGVRGGLVPMVISSNTRYTSKFSCLSAYEQTDVCYAHAEQIQHNLRAYNTLGQCSNWIQQEYNNCKTFINNAIRQCHKLKS